MIKAQNHSVDQGVFLAERRRHLRLQVPLQVEIRPAWIDVPMRLETADVSLGGCYVEMALTLDVGTKLEMVIWLGEHKMCTRELWSPVIHNSEMAFNSWDCLRRMSADYSVSSTHTGNLAKCCRHRKSHSCGPFPTKYGSTIECATIAGFRHREDS
jgi:c-di-GMP-binding flagellar brake protein YcgR